MVFASLMLTACAEDAPDSSGANPPATSIAPATTTSPAFALPAAVEVFVEFPRYLHAARRLEVGFDNGRGDTELTVTEVALRSPLFEDVAADPRDTDIEAGRRRDLQIGLGAPVCPAPPGPSMVEVTVEIAGVPQHGLVEIDAEPLERISADECGKQFVLEQIDIGYGPDRSVTDGVVATTIEIERREGSEPLVVTAVRGSVLLELTPDVTATPLATATPEATSLSIPVRLRVIRCDPHAVIESKKTFNLSVWVAIGDREPQHLVVIPQGDLRTELEQLIQDCLRAQ